MYYYRSTTGAGQTLRVYSPAEAAICSKSWAGPGLRPPLSLSQSSFFLPSRGLRVGLGRARSPAAKHFEAIYACSQTAL